MSYRNKTGWEIRFGKRDFIDIIFLQIKYAYRDDNGLYAKNALTGMDAGNVEVVHVPEAAEIPWFTTLSYEDAQVIMDDLWKCGLRPTEGKGSAGQLKAVEYHLEDMRKLVFNEESK